MNIVFVSAEVGPWSKTGGLGDVTGEAAVTCVELFLLCALP
jgi:glycogen synthase